MAYDGPLSGVINFIPLQTGTGSSAPTIELGSDGEFALDLNTGILYGPKDGGNTGYPWPVASRLWQGIVYKGNWGYPTAYKPGDIVVDNGSGTSRQYLCLKPIVIFPTNVNSGTTGSWIAGDFVYDTTAAALYICIQDVSTPPSTTPLGGAGYWLQYSPYQDWQATYTGYNALGNWMELSSVVADTSVGAGQLSRWVLASNSVDTAQLYNNAVTTAKITDANVTDAKLSATGVTAGTYPKVTVTSKGRVTVGSPLASTDIPCPLDLQPLSNSTAAFRVRNAAGTVDVLKVDTSNTEVLVAQALKVQTILDGTATSWVKSSDGTSVLNVNTTNKRTEVSALTTSGVISTTNSVVVSDTTALPSSPDGGRSNVVQRWVFGSAGASDRAAAIVFDNSNNQRDILRVIEPANTAGYRVQIGDASTALCVGLVLSAGNATGGGSITLNNAMNMPYRAISAARTLDTTDYIVNCTANTFTVTLPTASGNTGRVYIVKNSGTGTITVACTGAQVIDGAATQSLATQYSLIRVVSNGSNWNII